MKQTTETAKKDKRCSLSVSGQPVGAGHTLRRLLWAPLALALAVGFGTSSTAGTSAEAATINPAASMKGIDGPEDSVYAVAEEMPVYPGGGQAVLADIAANCRYPVEEKKPKKVSRKTKKSQKKEALKAETQAENTPIKEETNEENPATTDEQTQQKPKRTVRRGRKAKNA